MSFAHPFALLVLALVPLVVLFYFRRPRRVIQRVPALFLWDQVLAQHAQRGWLQRLRHPLSLALQLAILTLLALAAGGLEPQKHPQGPTVLVADTSAGARLLGKTGQPISRAVIDQIKRVLNSEAEAVAMVGLDAGAPVLLPFGEVGGAVEVHQERLAESLRPTEAAPTPLRALQRARDLLHTRGSEGKILWVSHQAPPDRDGIQQLHPGEVGPNIVITHFDRTEDREAGVFRAFVSGANLGSEPWRGRVELSKDGRILNARVLEVDRFSRWESYFQGPLPGEDAVASRGWLTVQIGGETGEVLGAFHAANAVLGPRKLRRILLVGREDPFVEQVLRADPTARVDMVTATGFQAEMLNFFDVIVLTIWPEQLDLSDLETGRWFFVGVGPAGRSKQVDFPAATSMEATDPLVNALGMEWLMPVRGRVVSQDSFPDWNIKPLVQTTEGSLVFKGVHHNGQSRIVGLGFGSDDSELPLRVAFPLFFAESLHWLMEDEQGTSGSMRVGEMMSLPQKAVVSGPESIGEEVWEAPFFVPRTAGFYRLTHGDDESWVAVNPGTSEMGLFTSKSEEDMELWEEQTFPWSGWGRIEWMRFLALCAMMGVLVDVVGYRKRWLE